MLISKWTGKKVKELKLKGYEDSIDEMWMKLIIFDLNCSPFVTRWTFMALKIL